MVASGPITSWETDGETMETVRDFIFLGSKITADGDCNREIKRRLLLGRKALTNLDSIFKNRDITLPTKVSSQGSGFFSSHVWMWELEHKEGCALKNWCFQNVVLEKTIESPLDCSTLVFLVHHQFSKLAQTHVHWASKAIQLPSPSPPALNLSQHQGLFQWASYLLQMAKVLEFQLQHQSFQWIFRTDFL